MTKQTMPAKWRPDGNSWYKTISNADGKHHTSIRLVLERSGFVARCVTWSPNDTVEIERRITSNTNETGKARDFVDVLIWLGMIQ